ncbi:hypothetical protein BCR34DRAFT_189439 [Clohesyomyces aquaticus]|uniref:Uncharacterized protein n=1 Tax=Clohesyomyces aquaticus TaxID=1231657 RepID=A0A1Y1ZXZ9_9PLEO|nr:hypothetical protein BCR34DRAFT_189439 [Clohesyomyces aquaticus]
MQGLSPRICIRNSIDAQTYTIHHPTIGSRFLSISLSSFSGILMSAFLLHETSQTYLDEYQISLFGVPTCRLPLRSLPHLNFLLWRYPRLQSEVQDLRNGPSQSNPEHGRLTLHSKEMHGRSHTG